MSVLTDYQLLALIALVFAGVMLTRDFIRSLITMKRQRDALTIEVKELKAELATASKTRSEIVEEAYEMFHHRLTSSVLLQQMALRQLLDALWEDNPKGTTRTIDRFAKDKRKNER